ncbi:MAG TPA: beta-N-acetylhexosaminidase [Terriglobales bacterium]|nr:beta-N-acetylhexosaminidase [Terriglobales bacterium]
MTKLRTDFRKAIGQLLIIGFDGTEMSRRLRALLTGIQPAGVILFARNIVAAEQTYRLLKECQACVSARLFTCVDMEGGEVDRFRNVLGRAPAAADVFRSGDRRLSRKQGRVLGEACRALGFNTDFAPVVDLVSEVSREVMSSRAVSANPAEVIRYARDFLDGLRSAGVLGTLKHFPGLGEANLDTHHALPSVHKAWKQLWEQDLAPYRALRREAPLVLVGHAAYPAVTRSRTPASLSKKWIRDILQKKVGYRGLVVSDDLEMGGVLKAAPIEQAAVAHIRAGGDLCLVCHLEEHVVRCHEALTRAWEQDREFARRCRQSIERVLAFKHKSRELHRPTPAPNPLRIEKLTRRLWELGEQVRFEQLTAEGGGGRRRPA